MKQQTRIADKILRFNDWFLALVMAFFIFLRLPSLFEPYWYGDEGIYETIGKAIMHGRVLYQGIWDNKPPLLYLIYALFDGDQFWVRLSSLIVGLAAVVIFYLLSKVLFKRTASQYISTLIFMFGFALPLLEGNIANAENFILLPVLLTWYGIYRLFPHKKSLWWFGVLGMIMALAVLTKVVAVFDLAAMGVFMVLLSTRERPSTVIKNIQIWVAMAGGFLLPIVVTSMYFLSHHAFRSFFSAVFSQNIDYVGVNNYLLFPLGLVVLKIALLLIGLALLWLFRKRLPVVQLLIFTWFLLGMFSAFFSERPYTHYLLMVLPSFSLLFGLFWERKVNRVLYGTIIAAAILLIVMNFTPYWKIGGYYQNYTNYVLGNETADQYQRFFDWQTPRDYTLADFIKNHIDANDTVFYWTDSGQLYALSDKLPPGRYIVAYHITFYGDGYSNTQQALAKQQPKYIVSTRDDIPAMFIKNYRLRYHYSNAVIYERAN